jgi:hypothetical protein
MGNKQKFNAKYNELSQKRFFNERKTAPGNEFFGVNLSRKA